MTDEQRLYQCHKALEMVEWIDTHARSRAGTANASRELATKINGLTKWLTRMMEEFAPPQPH